MRTQTTLLLLLASLTASGCQQVECADGTVERDGKCVSPNFIGDPAKCGPFTELVGDQCVPMFPPTMCDPGSTQADTDPDTGVTTCVGMGGNPSCDSLFPCMTPTGATKQTICGQLYDFETSAKFSTADPKGQRCDPANPTADGPCALTIKAYDAQKFAEGMPIPLSVGDLYIDDCGRYRLTDIETSAVSVFIGLGVDDANGMTTTGVTVTSAVATQKQPKTAVKDLEAFIVKPATAMGWMNNLLTTGVYAPIFRAHKLGNGDPFANQAGVVAQYRMPAIDISMANAKYFPAAQTTRTSIDNTASMTGANGTVLINNASLNDSISYTGRGGIDAIKCRWELKAAASLPGIVFVQVFRKIDNIGETCAD